MTTNRHTMLRTMNHILCNKWFILETNLAISGEHERKLHLVSAHISLATVSPNAYHSINHPCWRRPPNVLPVAVRHQQLVPLTNKQTGWVCDVTLTFFIVDAQRRSTSRNDHLRNNHHLTFATIMRWPKILHHGCVSLFAWEWPPFAYDTPHSKNAYW